MLSVIKELGKPVPEMVMTLSPKELSPVEGVTALTVKGTLIVVAILSGIKPLLSVTNGYQEPATGVTVHMI